MDVRDILELEETHTAVTKDTLFNDSKKVKSIVHHCFLVCLNGTTSFEFMGNIYSVLEKSDKAKCINSQKAGWHAQRSVGFIMDR